MRMTLALVVFFILTFILTWAIREGGSFAFLHPSHWRKRPEVKPPADKTGRVNRH
jgi:hypothetical protein